MLSSKTSSEDGDRFRLAMASSGIGMAIADGSGRWVDVNPAMERMFGFPAREMVGRSADDFTHAQDIHKSHDYVRGMIDGNTPALDLEKRYIRRDGSTMHAHLNIAVMRGPDDKASYLIVQIRDISAQRHAEAQLKALNDTLEKRVDERTAELAAVNRQQELFAYGISHDLRAPLRAIDSFSSLLQVHGGTVLDEIGRDYLERIRSATQRMSALIDSLLELSRASRVEMKHKLVDLSLLAEWVGAELCDGEPTRANVIDVQPGIMVCGDERQLKLLLDQLMHNAWKFARDRERVEITVTATREADTMHIVVCDNGIGFDMRYAQKMFEPFQRLHGPEQAGGNGIGLAIAQRIVERHGGHISARSEDGVGSVLQLQLRAPRNDGDAC